MKNTLVLIVATLAVAFASSVAAETRNAGSFTEKEKTISGNWSIEQTDGQTRLVFDDSFRARSGPDLKIFLSSKEFSKAKGSNATQQSVLVAELKSNKGSQSYLLPEGLDLSAFNSLLIHCEKYSVLWGGSQL